MKKILYSLILAAALPSIAHAAETAEKKPCCCAREDGTKGCCEEKMKEGEKAQEHTGHEVHTK